jgi:hypothetical protein
MIFLEEEPEPKPEVIPALELPEPLPEPRIFKEGGEE